MFDKFIQKKYIENLKTFSLIDFGSVEGITPEDFLLQKISGSNIDTFQSSSDYDITTNTKKIKEVILSYNSYIYIYLKYIKEENSYLLNIVTTPTEEHNTIKKINELIKRIKNGNNSERLKK